MGDELAAGRAAAPVRFGQFDEFQPIDHFQQCSRLFPDTLTAPQVTGIVVGDTRFDAPLRLFERDGHQEFAHIPDLCAERCSPLRPGRDHPPAIDRNP